MTVTLITCYGNIFRAEVDAIVNPVNTVGVMGAGLAKQFKDFYPENYKEYKNECDSGLMRLGQVFVTEYNERDFRYIINFPTKGHWKNPSTLSMIEDGMDDLVQFFRDLYDLAGDTIRSIAMPALGCGLGGLEWPQVKKIIESKIRLFDYYDIELFLYPPK